MQGNAILETKGVRKEFNGFVAVANVDYTLYEGETAGIIGPNGAGKSTFFNLLTGMFPPSRGQVLFAGRDISRLASYDRVAAGIIRTFQLVSVFDSLKVLDNLVLANARFGGGHSTGFRFFLGDRHGEEIVTACRNALEMVGIADKADWLASELSYGDKRKLEIAMALSLRPKILLLDEPFAGLSDAEITDVLELVERVKKGFSLVIIEHKISRIVDLVDKLSVMHEGSIIAEGKPAEVLADREVRRVYWGQGGADDCC